MHGRVLLYIYRHPGRGAAEISHGLGLNPGTIWAVIGDLRNQGMLNVERRRRRHYYSVNTEATVRHPVLQSVRLGTLLSGLALP